MNLYLTYIRTLFILFIIPVDLLSGTVQGKIEYSSPSGIRIPLSDLKVELWDSEAGLDENIGTTNTGSNGVFYFLNINNDDGVLQKGRDLYIKIIFDTSICKIKNNDPLFQDAFLWWGSYQEGVIDEDVQTTDKTYNVKFEISQVINDVAKIYYDTISIYTWFLKNATWGRQKVDIKYDPDKSGTSEYSPCILVDWWILGEFIILYNDDDWSQTVWHEYGHAIMFVIYNNEWPSPRIEPTGEERPPGGGHFIVSESSVGFALTEGWAQFCEHAIDNNIYRKETYYNGKWQNIEDNDWWMGVDGDDGTNYDHNSGDIVEGAVASIFWDIYDGTNDDAISNKFNYIWNILKTNRPNSIKEFAQYWVNRNYGQLQELWEIYRDNGIDIGYITSLDELTNNEVSKKYLLHNNFPNPFNPVTTIRYELPRTSDVRLEIFNLLGQRIETLVSGIQEAGSKEVKWNGSRYPSGVYLYRLQTGTFIETRKMMLVK